MWALLQLKTGHGYVLEGFGTACSFDYFSRDILSRILMMSMLIGGFIIPLAILITFFDLTRRHLQKKTKEMGENHMVFTRSQSNSKTPTVNSLSFSRAGSLRKSDRHIRYETKVKPEVTQVNRFSYKTRQHRVMRTILFNMIGFCIAWGPYAVITTVAQFSEHSDIYVTPITTSLPALLAKTSAIYNPFLYTLTNRECRKYFRRALFYWK